MATYSDWREPVELLETRIDEKPTSGQLDLAALVKLPLQGDEPRQVVAAMLEDYLTPMIHDRPARHASDSQRELLMSLLDGGSFRELPIKEMTSRVAFAWVEHLIFRERVAHLRSLKLKAGDKVWVDHQIVSGQRPWAVSSIGAAGRIHLKGNMCPGVWPNQVRRVEQSV
jgi:hypothetical protein